MATITSHILDGTDGSHASGITVTLIDRETGKIVFEMQTDTGGRLSRELAVEAGTMDYELTCDVAAYWAGKGFTGSNVIREIVLRFSLDDPDTRVHMPVIISPYSYSTWKSG